MAAAGRKPGHAKRHELAMANAAQVIVPSSCDVLVVGCGASGLAAAISAASSGAHVVALDAADECGRPILATGNGRCNLSNTQLAQTGWGGHYTNPDFVQRVMGPAPLPAITHLMETCGIALTCEDDRLYPASMAAASVREALVARAQALGVCLAPARKVNRVAPHHDGFLVCFDELFCSATMTLSAKAVVVASGGGACECLSELGLASHPATPVLCALRCSTADGSSLEAVDGRRVRGSLTTPDGWTERGEVLLRSDGVSGIVAFDLSRRVSAGDTVTLDMAPSVDAEHTRALAQAAGNLCGLVHPDISTWLIAMAGSLDAACDLLHALPLHIDGLTDTGAQVTRGGLDVAGFGDSLEATSIPGLFCCGEALDVDADCGGFNLSWAWMSGTLAGKNASAHCTERTSA